MALEAGTRAATSALLSGCCPHRAMVTASCSVALQLHEPFIFHTQAGPRCNETNTAIIRMSRDIRKSYVGAAHRGKQ